MNDRNIFTLLIIALMVAMLVGAFEYYGTAAFGFPFAVSLLVLLMAGAQLVRDIVVARRGGPEVIAADQGEVASLTGEDDSGGEKPRRWAGVAQCYAVLFGFLFVAYFVSYLVAAPLFIFVMTYWYCRERLLPSAIVALGSGALIYVIFGQILHSM